VHQPSAAARYAPFVDRVDQRAPGHRFGPGLDGHEIHRQPVWRNHAIGISAQLDAVLAGALGSPAHGVVAGAPRMRVASRQDRLGYPHRHPRASDNAAGDGSTVIGGVVDEYQNFVSGRVGLPGKRREAHLQAIGFVLHRHGDDDTAGALPGLSRHAPCRTGRARRALAPGSRRLKRATTEIFRALSPISDFPRLPLLRAYSALPRRANVVSNSRTRAASTRVRDSPGSDRSSDTHCHSFRSTWPNSTSLSYFASSRVLRQSG
jgi:hypothetical protein